MQTLDPKELADKIISQMKEDHHIFWVDPEIHSAQHEFIQMLIDERKEKKERREKIKTQVAGSLILSGILGTIALLGSGALEWLSKHIIK